MRAIFLTAMATLVFASLAFSWQGGEQAKDIEREKLVLAGWDPDEPVPAYAYYKKGNQGMPVIIFLHGMGGSKEQSASRLRELARQGFFVLAIDAHLHGERKVPGIFPQGKSLGSLGTDYAIWVHQTSVSHTARDVSRCFARMDAAALPGVFQRLGIAGTADGTNRPEMSRR